MVVMETVSRWRHRSFVISLVIMVSASTTLQKGDKPSNIVSIEDPTGLDEGVAIQKTPETIRLEVKVQTKKLPGLMDGLHHSNSDDEDDGMTSGSGSGDNIPVVSDNYENMTPTRPTLTVKTTTFNDNNEREGTTNNIRDLKPSVFDYDNSDIKDVATDEVDSAYDLPGGSSVDINRVLIASFWATWSEWFLAGARFKVRVRICNIDGKEVSEAACGGVWVQMKSCDSTNSTQCGQVQDFSVPLNNRQAFYNLQGPPSTTSYYTPLIKSNLDLCQYSLYDTNRLKYIYSHWTPNELTTNSKTKKWCDKNSGQYIVMSTPKDYCRQYYKDLCKTSERCRAAKPAKEWSDLSEDCWRQYVYEDTFPIGFSNFHPNVYFICQRFAAQRKLGKIFGPKDTYFATLYDTSLRSPVFSMSKITRLGDDSWPDTDYFIERGLLEEESQKTSLLRKDRKGVLTIGDLGRCSDDPGCDLRLRQVMPSDYEDSKEPVYYPTHLLWPDLMSSDPKQKLSTFTLTNMAPLHSELFQEWHDAIGKVRQYAIEQCGITTLFDPNLSDLLPEVTSHRTNTSAMFVISGVVPSRNPVVTTGRNIHVPHMFWLSGCCVTQNSTTSSHSGNNNINSDISDSFSESWNSTTIHNNKKNVKSFSIHILNSPGSHVIAASVLQLEMLLRDNYRLPGFNFGLSLFPGHGSDCSNLRHDVSHWFQ